jgi:hypothetical protein
MKRKGQAAADFLMTYGWVILAIVVVAAVLWNMGVFNTSQNCKLSIYEWYNYSGQTGAQGFEVPTSDCNTLKANCDNTKDYMKNPCEWRESLQSCDCFTTTKTLKK